LGGLRFYDRKEIKDAVAYLRLIFNRGDNISLKRIINEPKEASAKQPLKKRRSLRAHTALACTKYAKTQEGTPSWHAPRTGLKALRT
jgi:superfamily I DNA/RNA helicase